MGVIDWIILAVLIVFMYLGWRRGLAATLIKLAGLVAAFFLIGHIYPLVRRNLEQSFGLSGTLSTVLALLLFGLLMWVLTRIVIIITNRMLAAVRLSGPNKFAGLLLGLFNGLILVMTFTLVLDHFPRVSAPLKDGSRHRVYAGISELQHDVVHSLKLKQRVYQLENNLLPKAGDAKKK